jgi:hypothetical protein
VFFQNGFAATGWTRRPSPKGMPRVSPQYNSHQKIGKNKPIYRAPVASYSTFIHANNQLAEKARDKQE